MIIVCQDIDASFLRCMTLALHFFLYFRFVVLIEAIPACL